MEVIGLVVWIAVVAFVVVRAGTTRAPSVGIPLAFALMLTMTHLFGAAIHILGWQHNIDSQYVTRGFTISLWGLIAYVAGAHGLSPQIVRYWPGLNAEQAAAPSRVKIDYDSFPRHLLFFGLALVAIVFPALGHVPGVPALSFTGAYLVIVAICLAIYSAITVFRSKAQLILVLGVWGVALPLFSLIFTHNIVRAVFGLLAITAFFIVQTPHRLKALAFGAVLFYVGLSIGVGYLSVRETVRSDLRTGSIAEKMDRIYEKLDAIEPFNPVNQVHLDMVDARMNQNILIGTAASHLELGREEFARGETMWLAILAMIPRAIWPDKPVKAGSMGLASKYTGTEFDEQTSVGLGPIFEFYLNFGMTGVLLGMLCLGVLAGTLDLLAGRKLGRGDWAGATPLFAVALTITSVEGAFAELTASAVAAVLMSWAAYKWHAFLINVRDARSSLATAKRSLGR